MSFAGYLEYSTLTSWTCAYRLFPKFDMKLRRKRIKKDYQWYDYTGYRCS